MKISTSEEEALALDDLLEAVRGRLRNGWPDHKKPGVPPDPKKSGWRWVSMNGAPYLIEWCAKNKKWHARDDCWSPAFYEPPEELAEFSDYIDSCNLPNEVAEMIGWLLDAAYQGKIAKPGLGKTMMRAMKRLCSDDD